MRLSLPRPLFAPLCVFLLASPCATFSRSRIPLCWSQAIMITIVESCDNVYDAVRWITASVTIVDFGLQVTVFDFSLPRLKQWSMNRKDCTSNNKNKKIIAFLCCLCYLSYLLFCFLCRVMMICYISVYFPQWLQILLSSNSILECKLLLYKRKKRILFRIISKNYQIILLIHSSESVTSESVTKHFTTSKLDLLL